MIAIFTWFRAGGWRLLLYAGLVVVGWTIRGWLADRDAFAEHLQLEQQRTKQLNEVLEREHVLQNALGIQEAQHYNELQEFQHENTNLRNRVDAGIVGLRVAAKCPTIHMPQNSSQPAVDEGTRAELDPTAGSAYYALREGIERTQKKLSACQERLATIEKAFGGD